jgi:hypothetical protein
LPDERQVAWAAGKPKFEGLMLVLEANTNAFFGRLETSVIFYTAQSNRLKGRMGRRRQRSMKPGVAVWEAMFGNAREARHWAESALALSTGRGVQHSAACALAAAGDSVRAKTLADDLDKRFPEGTLVQFNYLPSINAKLALRRRRTPVKFSSTPLPTHWILSMYAAKHI